ncbi:MAG: ZIP family metal transporter [Saprospiraceae bacterium]|nr:ZIP family metal transporter [Saprospiraceae bacterium]
MNIYLILSTLFFPVIICGIIVLLIKIENKALRLLLAFSGAYLLTISFTHIIPEIYGQGHGHIHNNFEGIEVSWFILAGFFIQIILEYFTQGIEHGHEHQHEHDSIKIAVVPLMIGICLHAFFEGMPFSEHFSNEYVQRSLLIGVVIHKVPIAIVLMSLFLNSNFSKRKSFILLIIFALAAPAGSLVSQWLGWFVHDIEQYFRYILAFIVGIFLHISTTILFESCENHRFKKYKLLIIILGIALALLN